jgi:hypothetical protein
MVRGGVLVFSGGQFCIWYGFLWFGFFFGVAWFGHLVFGCVSFLICDFWLLGGSGFVCFWVLSCRLWC